MTKKPISDPVLRTLAETMRHRLAKQLESLRVHQHISIRGLVAQLSIGDKTLQSVWEGKHRDIDLFLLVLRSLLQDASPDEKEDFFNSLKEILNT